MYKRIRRLRRLVPALVALALAGPLARAMSAETMLYRVFLADGSVLVSFGEFARVADRVVVSIPVGETSGRPNLQAISIAESDVDWEKTDRYTDAVRAKRYGETRGENDFAMLSGRVVEALNQVALTPDPARRLEMAEEARRNLIQWSVQNYGYRAADVSHLAGLFDEVIADLRVAAGQSSFDLNLVATTMPAPHVELLPDPTYRDTLEQALIAARVTPEPAERIALLNVVAAAVREPAASIGWAADLAARTSQVLAAELRTERLYKELSSTTITAATRGAERADVRGLQATIESVLRADDRLGRQRPQEIAALLAFVDVRLDEARRLRLARDAWAFRQAAFAEYRRKIAPAVDYLRRSKGWLDDIRDLAGPDPLSVSRLDQRVVMGKQALGRVDVPPELESVHSLLTAAFQMARRAATSRRAALTATDMTLAWEAASAASGALMLLGRADEELARLTTTLPQR